jgi:hypothetical protein
MLSAGFKEGKRLPVNSGQVLTGALLGGGSDALHKLITVFTNFMETSSKKAKGEEG